MVFTPLHVLRNVVCVLFPLLLSACHSPSHHHEETPAFPVTTGLVKDTLMSKAYVCQIHAHQHIELRAMERGYLNNIYVDEGQFVKQGQLMFRVMPQIYQAEYQRAEAELQFAEIEYKNTQNLADQQVVSENELALAKAKWAKAKADLALAKAHLDFTEVRAPFDGIMDKFHVRLGSFIEEGEFLTSLSDNRELWVYFNVPEAEYLSYMQSPEEERGKPVTLVMANGKTFPAKGSITAIEADFDNTTGTIAFRATFPNDQGLLRHGETGNIRMETPLPQALLIPQRATFEILEHRYVYVVDENGLVQARQIEVAAELPLLFAISSGLEATDRILLDGLRKVHEGETIEAHFISPKDVYSNLSMYAE